jgi:hypothetical protein
MFRTICTVTTASLIAGQAPALRMASADRLPPTTSAGRTAQ